MQTEGYRETTRIIHNGEDPPLIERRKYTVRSLLAEYNNVESELRLFLNRLYQTFLGSAAIVLASMGIKDIKPEFILVSPFLLIISLYVSLVFYFFINLMGCRAKEIEYQIMELNGGEPLMKLEHIWYPTFILPFRIQATSPNGTNQVTLFNPVYVAGGLYAALCVLFMVWAFIFLSEIYSTEFMIIYGVIGAILFLFGGIQIFRMIRFSHYLCRSENPCSLPRSEASCASGR